VIENLQDGYIVQPGVAAIGHAEQKLGTDMIDRPAVTGVFGRLGQRVDVPAGGGDPRTPERGSSNTPSATAA
jgi:hypothetical protein